MHLPFAKLKTSLNQNWKSVAKANWDPLATFLWSKLIASHRIDDRPNSCVHCALCNYALPRLMLCYIILYSIKLAPNISIMHSLASSLHSSVSLVDLVRMLHSVSMLSLVHFESIVVMVMGNSFVAEKKAYLVIPCLMWHYVTMAFRYMKLSFYQVIQCPLCTHSI